MDALFIRRTIKNKTIFLWIFYFLLSLYCENNNNITLPKLFLSAAGVLVICLIAYDGKLHKKIAMVFLYHFIWIAIEMLLGYTIMSIVTVKIEVPYKFPFSDGDIFIILGNALDNAIEGALKCVSRRYIHIKIIYRKENLFIKISNSFDGKVKKDRHGHLISMKSDLTRYGLGLALIEKSVNKYNGLLNFDIDEENFTLTVLLYS